MADERKPLARHDPLRLTGIDSRVRVCERRTRGHGCPRSASTGQMMPFLAVTHSVGRLAGKFIQPPMHFGIRLTIFDCPLE